MKSRDIEGLKGVIGLQREIAMAGLRPLLAKEEALRQQLADLAVAERDLAHSPALDDMRRVGQDGLWLRWIAVRHSAIQREMAMLRAQKSERAAEARVVVARHLAVQTVAKKFQKGVAKGRQAPS